ncbi:hypothetical protein HMPREF0083_01916 [Aneurinibacillus aneurinilyticus ATCC 12856]|uniref:Uncharacterized protein n=1 Tax=Aneurinibacillus aneurinilyticus ATCC 12856 TaxID=649747 RepID=U1YD11_ANEAE|nr:hypothetical protein HMPREF0083_01916 [Aneurinibacillus aneurinilyticus ATCC 12856]
MYKWLIRSKDTRKNEQNAKNPLHQRTEHGMIIHDKTYVKGSGNE